MDPLKKIEKELYNEMKRQMNIYYSAVSLALHREWGWGKDRIAAMYEETQKAWSECAASNKVSMVQMLEEETGVELRNEDGKCWRDLCFLNSEHPMNFRQMTKPQFLYMRKQQIKWQGTLIFACILLGMHRRYGFGPERLSRLVSQTVDIRETYSFDQKRLLDACAEECGITIQDKEKQGYGD